MKVRVLFFGATAEAAGSKEIQCEITGGETAGDVVESIRAKISRLASMKMLCAVNEEYVSPDQKLSDGDDIALFTAVSGG